MSQTVFILGAGASVEAGAPVMNDFLDKAERLRELGRVSDSQHEFDLVFKALAALNHAHSKAVLNVRNIEEVFAAFEMAKLIRRLDPLKTEDIESLPDAMQRVIVRTLEKSVVFPVEKRVGLKLPGNYTGFAELFIQLAQRHSDIGKRASIITFNYDICVDMALYQAQIPINYHLEPMNTDFRSIPLLKLHGSLNWFKCFGCGKPVPWKLRDYWTNRYQTVYDGETTIEISQRLHEFKHCPSATPPKSAYVVPPTWNKSQYHGELESVWGAAARELSTAANIIVCGYSLPHSDHFFRQLYALGTISDSRIRNFWVFDPDEAVKQRFVSLLGQAAIERFEYRPYFFDDNVFRTVRSFLEV
jgi:NAD-dependent SIR2 family protein deacetylase